MARSAWKGPFVSAKLIDQVEKVRESGKTSQIIKTWARSTMIIPLFVGFTFGVYNGKKFIPVSVTEDMVGHKLGEFSGTRTYFGHGVDKKKK